MNDAVRNRIFGRLKTALDRGGIAVPPDTPLSPPAMDEAEKINCLTQMMTAVRTEVHTAPGSGWTGRLQEILLEKGAKTLTYGPGGPIGKTLEAAWQEGGPGDLPRLVPYDRPVEEFKDTLFEVDAGITSALGGIADVGAVIIWPGEKEPRLLSLVPPVHIAVVRAGDLYANIEEAMIKQGWSDGMPTNALLVSGPSKTADIEFQLVFGVHGPKELVVLLLKDD